MRRDGPTAVCKEHQTCKVPQSELRTPRLDVTPISINWFQAAGWGEAGCWCRCLDPLITKSSERPGDVQRAGADEKRRQRREKSKAAEEVGAAF